MKLYFGIVAVFVALKSADLTPSMMDNVQETVKNWTEYLQEGLFGLSETISRRKRASESFKQARLVKEEGEQILQEIAKAMRQMMQEKINAVKRIKMHAETLSCQRKTDIESNSNYDFFDADNFTEIKDPSYAHLNYLRQKEAYWRFDNPNTIPFPGAKCEEMLASYDEVARTKSCVNKPQMEAEDTVQEKGFFRNLTMRYHPHYDENVNLDFSVVRSTVSVYVRDKVVLNNIRWSEALDLTFKCNARQDPTLIWQYFASSSGFMRFYPAMQWPDEDYDKTYDHRTRSWYTESMTSPKDMIILLDRSGSMTGKRRKISRHIVHDILDTLADNDYVNVLTFANTTEPLITCFNDTLIQANEENLRLIRENLTQYTVKFHGRLDLAFEKAFEILKESHWKRSGIFCTQIIMVIAEGVDAFDDEAFEKLRKLNTEDEHQCKVRIFTYLLETVESDARTMLDIACQNMGYYVNISDVAEIREKVNMYTTVLSRSVNLRRAADFQPVWSALYVDLADRRLTNWLWQKDEGLRQRKLFVDYARIKPENPVTFSDKNEYAQYLKPKKYTYLTTVSLPVYDKREGLTTLLGVAAVDVPIDYMNKLTKPHQLGVNGYAFIITNNGYVLMHPDHRTNFKNILKPTFNRVDVTEVELSINTSNPRQFDDGILNLRYAIVNQSEGTQHLDVMTHMDDMKRIFFTTRHYYYTKIEPYSLVIALQENYGHNMLRYNFDESFNPSRIFQDHQRETWTLHPDWIYFERMKNLTKNVEVDVKKLLKEHLLFCEFRKSCNQDPYYDLLSSFLEDLRSTRWFENNLAKVETRDQSHYSKYESLYKSVIVAFMSTHTGLTRWQYLNRDPDLERNFGRTDSRSIDEIWYKRSVEENFELANNITYIFSIPLIDEMDVNRSEFNESQMVTVTHAIFKEKTFYEEDRLERSPAAVVGYQIRYSTFKALFQNLSCDTQINFGMLEHENVSCVVLDNHGYIMWSNNGTNVGRLILHHSKTITQKLEDDHIFDAVKVFDYQGICLPNATVKSCPSSGAENCRRTAHKDTLAYQKRAIQKTVPTPCDKEMRMYRYRYKNHFQRSDALCLYITRNIAGTNLAFLAYDRNCEVDELREELKEIYPKEEKYGKTGKLHLPCFIETNNNYYKRPYIKCITADQMEKKINVDIQYCGGNTKHARDEL